MLMVDGVKELSVIKAIRACDLMKTELRLGCRKTQHWFTAKRVADSGWVDQCICSEERLTAVMATNDGAASVLGTAAEFGDVCVKNVRAACGVPTLCLHRACSMSVLFGELHDEQWSVRSEGAAVLAALASAGLTANAGIVAFTLQLLTARVRSWVDSSVLRQEPDFLTNAPPPSLLGIASSLQWLASAREAISNREAEEDYDFGISPPEPIAAATFPDFSVLFCTRLHIWVAEVEVCLRALIAISEWWSNALKSQDSNYFNMTECAAMHKSLLRTVYSRSLALRRTWQYGRAAIGFVGEREESDIEDKQE